MADRQDQLGRDESDIEDAFARGEITDAERAADLRDLHNAYFANAREAANAAYDRELDRW